MVPISPPLHPHQLTGATGQKLNQDPQRATIKGIETMTEDTKGNPQDHLLQAC